MTFNMVTSSIPQNLHKHWMSLGGWTFAFNDYYEVNLTMVLDHPNTQLLMNNIDPICKIMYLCLMVIDTLVANCIGIVYYQLWHQNLIYHVWLKQQQCTRRDWPCLKWWWVLLEMNSSFLTTRICSLTNFLNLNGWCKLAKAMLKYIIICPVHYYIYFHEI